MNPLRLIEIALATWIIAFMISTTSGPFHVFEWIRTHLPLGGLTSCIICLSPWIACLIGLFMGAPFIECIAAAGLSLLLHSYTGWRFNNG